MSLYRKTQEEIYDFLIRDYVLPEKARQKIKNELIDGEVLYELNDDDFKNLGFVEIQIELIKYTIEEEKKEKPNEKTSLDDLIKKLNLFGIDKPNSYLHLNFEKMDLKIGQKKLLKKYKEILQLININSNITEILNFFRDNLQISEESIKVLQHLTGSKILKMNEKEISILKLKKEDEKKIMNLINIINNENDKKKENEEKKEENDKKEENEEKKEENDKKEENEEKKEENEEKKEINLENVPTDIEQKMKLEDMIIYEIQDKKITMELLYEKLKNEIEKIFEQNDKNLISPTNYYRLILLDQISAKINKIEDGIFFDFSIGNTVEHQLLIEPIKTKIKINNVSFDLDIISSNQIEFIIKKEKLSSPVLSCKKSNKLYDFDIYNLMDHKNCQDTLIYEYYKFFELKTEEEFKNFFPKFNKDDFESPEDFDVNFDAYFNKDKHIKSNSKFKYYKDIKERQLLSSKIKNPKFFGKFLVYYGFPGIGKSITVLHVLKYEINHENIKTLYIHCKHLNSLNKEYKYYKIKDLLLYEIPFLFYNDFSSYQEYVDLIKYFKFALYGTYIDQINDIINFLAKKPYKYLIVFDQYNQPTDPEEKIKNIERRILKDENIVNKFCFLLFYVFK